jgi:enediyne biosynthesis protein E4
MKTHYSSTTGDRSAAQAAALTALLMTFALALSPGCNEGGAGGSSAADSATVSTDADNRAADGAQAGAGDDAAGATTDAGPLCTKGVVKPVGNSFFSDISDKSGIRADNVVRNSTKPVPINDHSRLGFVDINGDGLDDIVTHSLYPNPQKSIPFEHLVYRNNGDGSFAHVSDASGLRKVQAGFFAFGDVDNDGDQDCFAGLDIPITGKTHQLLLNDGSGVFVAKAGSGVEALPAIAGNAVFADFNQDGKLDLFVGMGHTSFKAPNRLLIGNGDGTFADKSAQLNDKSQQPTNGSVACDYDNDGDQDIFVSNYGVSVAAGHNRLLVNNGDGTFVERGKDSGFAYQEAGNSWLIKQGILKGPEPKPGTMGFIGSNGFGLDCGDINGDGMLDIFATAISHPNSSNYSRTWSDPTQVLISKPGASGVVFINEATPRKVPFNEGDVDGGLVDFDNDGRLDLSVSRDKKYEGAYTGIDQKAWFGLLHQQPDGTFKSLGPTSGINDVDYTNTASLTTCVADSDCTTGGEKCLVKRCRLPCTDDAGCTGAGEVCHTGGFCKGLLRMKSAQNHAWADIDADGDMDLLVGGRDTGGGRPNFLFRNDVGNKLPWLKVRLVGDGKLVNRDAIGSRAVLEFAGGDALAREVKSSRGMHNSMDSRWLHFGLGDKGCDYKLVVLWSDGTKSNFSAAQLPTGGHYTIERSGKLSAWTNPAKLKAK